MGRVELVRTFSVRESGRARGLVAEEIVAPARKGGDARAVEQGPRAPRAVLALAILAVGCAAPGEGPTPPPPGAPPAEEPATCEPGDESDAACAPSFACASDADCAEGLVCELGECVEGAGCLDDAECGDGAVCAVSGECIAEGSCRGDADCDEGLHCSATRRCLAVGACTLSADCAPGTYCEGSVCVPGSTCGGAPLPGRAAAADFLLVLDRSCSMRAQVGNGDGRSKWEAAVSGLEELLARFPSEVGWGLTFFPDREGQACRQESFPYPIGEVGPEVLSATLDAARVRGDVNYPNMPCETPIDAAIAQAATDPSLDDPTRSASIVLITDGRSTCGAFGGDAGVVSMLEALLARGVRTYVVGFGGGVDEAQLARFATAGGTARDTAPGYYQADDAEALRSALVSIVGDNITCEYTLDEAPADASQLHAFFDGRRLTPGEEWSYDPATRAVVFTGAACEALSGGTVRDVEVVYGCPIALE